MLRGDSGNLIAREKEIEYAEKHNIPLKINKETNYSKDKNLWHLSHEGLDLEDPANEAPINKPGFLELGVSPEQAPDVPTYVTIHFEKGVPTAVNGVEMDSVTLIARAQRARRREWLRHPRYRREPSGWHEEPWCL